ncbi:Type 1 glutamine amidotransferase-like domain-containing protein [Rhodococcus tibetensis]|uniref:Peptidase E n=1 Tax=Rhodococcus tibetensis TaxID=2965064 RepID=A0ABT1QID0_9NOCA|nr:Type 1 glutamine amidotransferase-like domain-containing protein [Rhodococcus sp. FXJ9.536]MCQ4122015.1 peptidase E [Rhodococcus sp. FXJ9.536]
MRLFLSSYRFGADPAPLMSLVGSPGRVGVIASAADAWPPAARASAVVSDMTPLRRLGFSPEEVDLRDYIRTQNGETGRLRDRLAGLGMLWVRGGNTFVLRAQMARSGADDVIRDLLRNDSLVYAGYSAGACVMTPTLRGLDSSDDPAEVVETCGMEPIWEGLGVVPFAIVPHHPPAAPSGGQEAVPLEDAAAVRRTVATLRLAGMDYRTLTDEQAIVVDGDSTELI